MKKISFACVWLFVVAASTRARADGPDDRTVPNLVGKTAAEANALVLRAGFTAEAEIHGVALNEYDDDCQGSRADVPLDHVMCQDPAAGKVIDKNDRISVVVWMARRSLKRRELDSLIGLTVEQAKAKVAGLGFTGRIAVKNLPTFVKECGFDKVCGHEPESGVSVKGELALFVNEKTKIAAPPP